jgi:hypothetical protein
MHNDYIKIVLIAAPAVKAVWLLAASRCGASALAQRSCADG